MASSNKSLAAFAGSKKTPRAKKSTKSTWGNYMAALVNQPDLSEALKSISSFITALWTREHAVEYETIKLKHNDTEKRFSASNKTNNQLTTKLDKTDQRIPSAKVHGTKTEDGKLKWDIKDICLVCVTLFGAVVAVALGAANVYANLMGAELPIFIHSPWLAITLSMLLPIGSLSIKFMISSISYDATRRLCGSVLYSVTAILVLVWSYLFAQSFASVTGGGIDVEMLLSGSGGSQGVMLVWVQLLVELLAGSCLFVAAESIYIKYHPNYSYENPEYTKTKRALDEHEPAHIALRDELAELNGKLSSMDADLDATVNQHIAEFIAYRERVIAAHNPI